MRNARTVNPLYSHCRNHDPLKHSNDPSKLCCLLKAKSASYILRKYEIFNRNMNDTEPTFVPLMLKVEER